MLLPVFSFPLFLFLFPLSGLLCLPPVWSLPPLVLFFATFLLGLFVLSLFNFFHLFPLWLALSLTLASLASPSVSNNLIMLRPFVYRSKHLKVGCFNRA